MKYIKKNKKKKKNKYIYIYNIKIYKKIHKYYIFFKKKCQELYPII